MTHAGPVTFEVVQIAYAVAALLIPGMATLGLVWWRIESRRQETEDAARRNVEAAKEAVRGEAAREFALLHTRVSTLRDECVRRDEYHDERTRTEGLLNTIRDEIRSGISGLRDETRAGISGLGNRIDALYDGRSPRAGA